MAEQIILLLVLIVTLPHISVQSKHVDEFKTECSIEVNIKPMKERLRLKTDSRRPTYVEIPDLEWHEDGKDFGCSCYKEAECPIRFCPLSPRRDNIEMGNDCDTHYVVLEKYSENLTSSKSHEASVYSVEEPISRNILKLIDTRSIKYHFTKCSWILPKEYQPKGFPLHISNRELQSNLGTMYSVDMSFCYCTGDDLYIVTPLCYAVELAKIPATKTTSMFGHVGIIVSIPSLLITLIVYTMLPEMRNIHGLTLRGYVGCLLIAYTSMALMKTAKSHISSCLFFAYIRYFSFLGSFFWQNVMCFDIWWTFGGFRSLRGGSREPDRKKFLRYSIYAWGCAGSWTGICALMDSLPDIPEDLIRPEFTVESECWFKNTDAEALYFYGPMGVTFVFNLFFFLSTIAKIIRQKKDTARHLGGKDSKQHHNNKDCFNLYLKLFIIMGINWSMWIITWRFQELKHYIWYITESGNEYQGLIIFLIFIFKKNVLRSISERFGGRLTTCFTRDSTSGHLRNSVPTICTISNIQSQ